MRAARRHRQLANDVDRRPDGQAASRIVTAESCTGGLLAGALTAVPGSSDAFYGGFVTYANEAKIAMIGVPYGVLREFGAVSKECAIAMAEGAMPPPARTSPSRSPASPARSAAAGQARRPRPFRRRHRGRPRDT